MYTQDGINVLCYNIIAETPTITANTSKNISGKAWNLVFIPYHDIVNGANPTPITYNAVWSKHTE